MCSKSLLSLYSGKPFAFHHTKPGVHERFRMHVGFFIGILSLKDFNDVIRGLWRATTGPANISITPPPHARISKNIAKWQTFMAMSRTFWCQSDQCPQSAKSARRAEDQHPTAGIHWSVALCSKSTCCEGQTFRAKLLKDIWLWLDLLLSSSRECQLLGCLQNTKTASSQPKKGPKVKRYWTHQTVRNPHSMQLQRSSRL